MVSRSHLGKEAGFFTWKRHNTVDVTIFALFIRFLKPYSSIQQYLSTIIQNLLVLVINLHFLSTSTKSTTNNNHSQWISGFTALPPIYSRLTSTAALNGAFWLPQVIGGTGFIVSGTLFMLETQQKWYLPAFKVLGWHIGAWNLIGVSLPPLPLFFFSLLFFLRQTFKKRRKLTNEIRESDSHSAVSSVSPPPTVEPCIKAPWLRSGVVGVSWSGV